MLVSAVALGSQARGQKTPDLRIDVGSPPGATGSSAPSMAADGASVYVAWSDDRNGLEDIYCNCSADGGATWLAADLRLDTGSAPGASRSTFPRIAAAGDAVYVVWGDERNGASDLYLNRSLDRGASWLPADVRLSDGYWPEIAASGPSVYVVWRDFRGAGDIFFNRSLDGGSSWLPADVRIDAGFFVTSGPARIAASGASVYVTWAEYRNGPSLPSDILFNRSLDGGSTWLASERRLDVGSAPGVGDSFYPEIAASGSVVGVTWQDHRNGNMDDVYCNCSSDGGSTWLAQDVHLDLAAPAHVSQHPEIAVSGSSVYVAWMEDVAGPHDIDLNRSLDGGVSWLTVPVRLDTGPDVAYSSSPTLVASGSAVYVTWADSPGGISFNRSLDHGTTWLPSHRRIDLGPGGYPPMHPRIAVAGSSAYVAWIDFRDNPSFDNTHGAVYFDLALGFQRFGRGTPGTGGRVPTISGSGHTSTGATFTVHVANGRGGALGFLFVGTNGAAQKSGLLLVQPPLLHVPFTLDGTPGAPGAGSTSMAFPVPNDLTLLGTRLDFQARILDPGAPSRAVGRIVTLTAGLEAWIL